MQSAAPRYATTTPIKHVVVIFGENISFDHYFATYPYATNPTTETPFTATDKTPRVNNLLVRRIAHCESEQHAAVPHGSNHVGDLRPESQLRPGTER